MATSKKKKQETEKLSARIPPRVFYGSGSNTMIGNMASMAITRESFSHPGHEKLRRVLGYPVPTWQRPLVWTDAQCERFIQSVYAGVYLGLFVYNDALSTAKHLDGLLIDGQQRLHALERYLNGELAVAGPDGKKYLFTELTDDEKAHFYRIPFGFQVVNVDNEDKLKELYDLLNFGGTQHKPTERAAIADSDVSQALQAMRNLGVSLNDYDTEALGVLCDFAEAALVAKATSVG
jgi:hypothetical protein